MADDELMILAGPAEGRRLSGLLTRRGFLGVAGLGAASLAFLAACGREGAPVGRASAATTIAGPSSFSLFTWAQYDDPDLMKSFGTIGIDTYNNNDELLAKLRTSGASGYDMVVPTGPYVPPLVAAGLLAELDLTRIPNFANLDPTCTNRPFDPGNRYTICKDFGTTGWLYDTSVVRSPIETWSDFLRVAQEEASGRVSLLDSAADVCGVYFWANGIDWNTEDPGQLDACEQVVVGQLAPHVRGFTSYPGIDLAQGNYVLSQAFNGDARQGLLSVDDPERYRWGIGAPRSEVWMDNWCILREAKNVDAAYRFVNFILEPHNSARDLAFHGYDTGVTGVRELLPAGTRFLDMVFLGPGVMATLDPGERNRALARQIEILDKAKTRASS